LHGVPYYCAFLFGKFHITLGEVDALSEFALFDVAALHVELVAQLPLKVSLHITAFNVLNYDF
jgi:hypothetical protein